MLFANKSSRVPSYPSRLLALVFSLMILTVARTTRYLNWVVIIAVEGVFLATSSQGLVKILKLTKERNDRKPITSPLPCLVGFGYEDVRVPIESQQHYKAPGEMRRPKSPIKRVRIMTAGGGVQTGSYIRLDDADAESRWQYFLGLAYMCGRDIFQIPSRGLQEVVGPSQADLRREIASITAAGWGSTNWERGKKEQTSSSNPRK